MVLLWGGSIRISFLEKGEGGHVAFAKLFSEAGMHSSSLQIYISSLETSVPCKPLDICLHAALHRNFRLTVSRAELIGFSPHLFLLPIHFGEWSLQPIVI